MRLNVGCGAYADADPDVINLDAWELPGVQVVHDLDHHPWPFTEDKFTEVRGVQVFEHVADPVGFMREAWRVLEPDGLLFLVVPHWQSENSYTDPTHRRHCTERTWDYWCIDTPLYDQFGRGYAGPCRYRKESVVRTGEDIHARMRKVAP